MERTARRVALMLDLQWPYKRHAEVYAGIQRFAEERGWLTIIDEFAHDTLRRRQSAAESYAGIIARGTWTSQQLAECLGPDIRIGRRQTRRYLTLMKAGYRRTAQTVGHKQDPKKVERAKAVLSNLKKKLRRAG